MTQEVEPVGYFPTQEILKKWDGVNNAQLFDEWVQQHGELLQQALSGDEVTRSDCQISVLRRFPAGSTILTTLYFRGYVPSNHRVSDGFAQWEVIYDQGDSGHDGEFEKLEILPERMGIRLRKELSDPHTEINIDSMGIITTIQTPLFSLK